MSLTNTKAFRFLFCPAVFLVSLGWLLLTERLLGAFALALVFVAYLRFLKSHKTALMRLAWAMFVVSTLLPFDVSFKNYPGPPRFVPLVMGTLTEADAELEKRGEVMIGGCTISGYEPKWVWVW